MRRTLLAANLLVALAFAPLGVLAVPAANAAKAPAKAPAAVADPAARADAFWARAKQEVYRSPGELAAQHARELRKGLRYRKLMRGAPGEATIALTFDDGPHPQFTPKILAILDRYNVKATFFVVGEMAEKYPDLIQAERAAGHLLGNHTYHHVNLTRIPFADILTEWQACQDVVKSITGDTMRFCRPPGGDYDAPVIRAAMDLNLTTVLWTDDPGDYASPGATVIEKRTLRRIGNGGIILLHDGVQQTLDVLPQIIENLQRRRFRFVTISQMQTERAGLG
jgi:peptidoglycan/xylan/chitin deacetylase (PgdA/CDA1 family)